MKLITLILKLNNLPMILIGENVLSHFIDFDPWDMILLNSCSMKKIEKVQFHFLSKRDSFHASNREEEHME